MGLPVQITWKSFSRQFFFIYFLWIKKFRDDTFSPDEVDCYFRQGWIVWRSPWYSGWLLVLP